MMKKRTFDQEYKIQAVELCLEGDRSIAQVAKESGLAYNALHRWVKEYKEYKEYKESNGTSFVGSGNIKSQNQEIIELRRRNQELEEECAILKKRYAS
jgi:transposase